MLQRANSKSSNRLSRRKSTSSVQSKHGNIEPEIARQHAQAAAAYAFARAHERESAEMGLSNILSRNNSISNRSRRPPQEPSPAIENGTGLRRRQSVRFAGPHAAPRRRSISNKPQQITIDNKASTASLRPRALTTNAPVPAAYRPPSRSSSIGKASIRKGTAESIVNALTAYEEYYTREDDIASTPSSYRRIRKSKSTKTLCSPQKASGILFENEMPVSDYNTRIWNKVPWIPNQPNQAPLRAPKSMSFLRGGRDHMTPAARQERDMAVQVARDKFLHQIEQQRLREQPSFLFRNKSRREEKPFRHSVRIGSTSSYGIPVSSASQEIEPAEESFRGKARKASRTIKKRLKSLFGLHGDEPGEVAIPNQQVDARKSHGSNDYAATEYPDIPRPDDAIVSRVASRTSSIRIVASAQQLKSRTGSIKSFQSDGSGKSRVTSWTSTAENTLTSRQALAEKERQRLSIIQENGTHVSSSSLARRAHHNQFSAYPAFHRPRSTNQNGPSRQGPVDSQRVYSALMKRLDENSPTAKLEAQLLSNFQQNGPITQIPPRTSSVNSRHSSRSQPPATIRRVPHEGAETSCGVYENTLSSPPQETDDVFSPRPPSGSPPSRSDPESHTNPSSLPLRAPQDQAQAVYQPKKFNEANSPTPQQMAARNELLVGSSRPLRETRSTFFGNSSLTIRRSTSPYRRALAEADYNPPVITGEQTVGSNPRVIFPPPVLICSDPQSNEIQVQVEDEMAYTESVYSRTTSGHPPAAESSQSLPLVDEDLPPCKGSSAILADRVTYKPAPPPRCMTSPAGSVECEGWLSSEITSLENSKGTDGKTHVNYALPSMPKSFGHVREHAQITDEEVGISQPKARLPKQPLGIIQQNLPQPVQLKPILKQNLPPPPSSIPIPPPLPPPPPPLPIRSPLRPTQSQASLRSVETSNTTRTLSATSSSVNKAQVKMKQMRHPRSSTNVSAADNSAKLIKRSGARMHNNQQSPGISSAVEKQFGSTSSRQQYSGRENFSPADVLRDEQYNSEGAGLMGPGQADAQATGSKRMVDLFLSSRRRRMAGSDESTAFL